MDISRDLILKGAAGLGATATAATGLGVAHSSGAFEKLFSSAMKIEVLAEKVEMKDCVYDVNNKNRGNCTLGEKINVYRWGDKEEIKITGENKKIKFEKVGEGYENGFKFTIENEITYETNKKLEANSTFEIRQIGEKWFLSKVSPLLNEDKEKMLGLPSGCVFPQPGNAYSSCTLNKDQLKAINFKGKIEGEINFNGSVSLEIRNNKDTKNFPEGYRFVFKAPNNEEITVQASPSPITLLKNTDIDFKIKKGDVWSLERAWIIETLASKVGLDCSIGGNECSIKDGEFDAFIDNAKLENIKKSEGSGGKIKFTEKQEGYGQGIKFTIEGEDINLSGSGANNKKLSSNSRYEIKMQGNSNEERKWYFSKGK